MSEPLTKERWLMSNAYGKELLVDEALVTIKDLKGALQEFRVDGHFPGCRYRRPGRKSSDIHHEGCSSSCLQANVALEEKP